MSKLPFEKMNAFILVPYSVLSGRLAIILANYNSVYGEHQGRSQTSEQDGASFERPRREPLRESGNLEAQKCSFKHFPWHFSSEKWILDQNQDEAVASSCLMLATALNTFKAKKVTERFYTKSLFT